MRVGNVLGRVCVCVCVQTITIEPLNIGTFFSQKRSVTYSYIFGGQLSFFGATGDPVLDFW